MKFIIDIDKSNVFNFKRFLFSNDSRLAHQTILSEIQNGEMCQTESECPDSQFVQIILIIIIYSCQRKMLLSSLVCLSFLRGAVK